MNGVSIFSRKNLKLIQERNISFEDVIVAIEDDNILDVLEHPNQLKYAGKKMYVIAIKDYIYLVPFIIDFDGNIILKTRGLCMSSFGYKEQLWMGIEADKYGLVTLH